MDKQITLATRIDPKLTSFLNAALSYVYTNPEDPETIERATRCAARAYVNGTCLIHESTAMHNEGVVARDEHCDLCGGLVDSTYHGQTQHSLCLARNHRGLPLPAIDTLQQCSCSPCRAARPAFS